MVNFKAIGDRITTGELNAYVSLLRHNKLLNDYIRIKNGEVNGTYSKYIFDINSSTIVDNGILITDETLQSLGTVKLSNPVFANATYTLTLTVLSMEEINILELDGNDPEEAKIQITLEENVEVPIPFETLNKYCIILFDAELIIKHDKPIIKNP